MNERIISIVSSKNNNKYNVLYYIYLYHDEKTWKVLGISNVFPEKNTLQYHGKLLRSLKRRKSIG